MLQRFILFGLIVIAQPCWAIVMMGDTLIIDGEVIYIEEREHRGADSLIEAKQSDFKKSDEKLPWSFEIVGLGTNAKTSWSLPLNENLMSIQQFLEKRQTAFGFGGRFAAYTQLHRHIHIGLGLDYAQMNAHVYSIGPSNTGNSIGFFKDENNTVNQVIEIEIQPGAYETDTIPLNEVDSQLKIELWSIPVHFRFYVNAYSKRQNWRAFGQISPTVFFQKVDVTQPISQTFLNENGQFLNAIIQNKSDLKGNVQIKFGIERRLTNNLQCHAGIAFQFPPLSTEHAGNSQLSIYLKNVDFGLRWSIGKWKD